MMSPEVTCDYRELLYFSPVTGDYVELNGPDSTLLPTNLFGGPVRVRLLVDVEESAAAAELGPHERHVYRQVFHSNGTAYGVGDPESTSVVLSELVPEGDYTALLLVAGVDPSQRDFLVDESNERYWLLLHSGTEGLTQIRAETAGLPDFFSWVKTSPVH